MKRLIFFLLMNGFIAAADPKVEVATVAALSAGSAYGAHRTLLRGARALSRGGLRGHLAGYALVGTAVLLAKGAITAGWLANEVWESEK